METKLLKTRTLVKLSKATPDLQVLANQQKLWKIIRCLYLVQIFQQLVNVQLDKMFLKSFTIGINTFRVCHNTLWSSLASTSLPNMLDHNMKFTACKTLKTKKSGYIKKDFVQTQVWKRKRSSVTHIMLLQTQVNLQCCINLEIPTKKHIYMGTLRIIE